MRDTIDFVVTWVDDNDPEWQKERMQYEVLDGNPTEFSSNRFRDWDTLKYWFRGIEKYAPWVNRVFLITCGHYPAWLNLESSKLVLIKHSDYIPSQYLPTYNSNVIELFLYKIPELSECFVLFNDDMFLIKDTKPSDFFKKGKPCETVLLGQISSNDIEDSFPCTLLNNSAIINKHFSKKQIIKQYYRKFLSPKYGKNILRTICLLPFNTFSAFYDSHLPSSHLKSTYLEVLKKEPDIFNICGENKFRCKNDISHWMLKNWRACTGNFVPRSLRVGKKYTIGEDEALFSTIREQTYKMICANDSKNCMDFEGNKKKLIEAFDTILPDKSTFEK